jgi:hypothetical protein
MSIDHSRTLDPTHVVVATSVRDTVASAGATREAVLALLDHADRIDLHADPDALATDHPEVARGIRESFRTVDDGYLRAAVDDGREALAAALALTSHHRFVSLDRIDLSRRDRPLARYVPDHDDFVVDADAATDPGALRTALAAALDGHAAGVLPARTLATWTDRRGRQVDLSPPSLCVENACFALAPLERVALDADAHRVELAWDVDDGVIGRILAAIGPSRPTSFLFDAHDEYAAVADAIRTVAAALDVPVDA